ncbi:acyltransferase family protein [Cryptosporangium aurantiacum]|uniref:Peptidoglycan/LPS O-acetylase OafA/YrhL, contains acyltransferase and SGNH-hydrolase domains n=1 Tax=Cryptosporangium aurantiacum TaxID=134849 RepID=A0A1M7Q727_9ACTN|nr:acyltransferase [Cryptosporangium aurantiacum]SHN26294.1 Peptidoglycan/LPS O-acetylase OafA/YrhL, contains acyltransferase and SGNH-hydrolase domains [Cryptosporangium aurantiacum]
MPSTASAPLPNTATHQGRDRYLDTLRALALFRVVAYHASPVMWFKWLPSMGIMFALAGSLMVRSMDKSAPRAVLNRLRRLLPVLWVFGAIWIPVMIWHDGTPGQWVDADGRSVPTWQLVFWLIPVGNPVGSTWGVIGWGVLWYIKTYLLFVALSPLLLPVFRRLPWVTMAAPFVLLALVETEVLPIRDWWGSSIGDALTYLGCWLIGFARADGILQRMRLSALLAIGGAVALAGVAWLLGPGNADATANGENPLSLLNSNLAIGLFYFGSVFILMRFSFRMEWLTRFPLLDRTITIFNSRAVTIFLWHGIALAIAVNVFSQIGVYQWYIWFPFGWVLIGAAVLLFGWIEDVAARRKPELLPGGVRRPTPDQAADAALLAPPPAELDAAPVSPAPRANQRVARDRPDDPDPDSPRLLP